MGSPSLDYRLTLERPSSHLIGVTITCEADGPLELQFPAWSPGRYFIYDFARNVQELEATGADGRAAAITKIAKGSWRIEPATPGTLTISYKVFANSLSGTFSQFDDRHAAINGSSVFAWIVGREAEEISLAIDHPDGWRVYTALPRRRRRGESRWIAGNFDILIDSPIEVGRAIARRFEIDGITYHVILDIAASPSTLATRGMRDRIDRYVADVERIVRVETAAFGTPEFDAYWFLVNIDPFASQGDGMEHLNSTRLVLDGAITDEEKYDDLLDVTAHEFVHVWNVKRLRPVELGPFDYTRERHTTLLWFAEGFTQYYGHLMVRRAGIWDDRRLFRKLSGELTTVDRSPGRFQRNLRESSFDTWHAVGGRNPMAGVSNFRNTWVNYYNKGAAVALVLDLEIRRATRNRRSLDDVMRELYRTSYHEAEQADYYLRGRGYTEREVFEAVEEVAGRPLRRLLERMIDERSDPDYRRALGHVGLTVERGDRPGSREKRSKDAPTLYTGIVPDGANGSSGIGIAVENVIPGSPADEAGLSGGDILLAIDGERVTRSGWEGMLSLRDDEAPFEVSFFRGHRLLRATLRPVRREHGRLRIEPKEKERREEKRNRRLWLEG